MGRKSQPERKKGTDNRVLYLIAFFGIIVIAVVSFSIWSKLNKSPSATPTPLSHSTAAQDKTSVVAQKPAEKPRGLIVMEHRLAINSQGRYVVEGRAQNNDRRTFSHAEIHFSLLDAQGNRVGTASAVITNLRAGMIWMFETAISEYNAVSARVDRIDTRH